MSGASELSRIDYLAKCLPDWFVCPSLARSKQSFAAAGNTHAYIHPYIHICIHSRVCVLYLTFCGHFVVDCYPCQIGFIELSFLHSSFSFTPYFVSSSSFFNAFSYSIYIRYLCNCGDATVLPLLYMSISMHLYVWMYMWIFINFFLVVGIIILLYIFFYLFCFFVFFLFFVFNRLLLYLWLYIHIFCRFYYSFREHLKTVAKICTVKATLNGRQC